MAADNDSLDEVDILKKFIDPGKYIKIAFVCF